MESWRVLLKTVCEKTHSLNGGDFCGRKENNSRTVIRSKDSQAEGDDKCEVIEFNFNVM